MLRQRFYFHVFQFEKQNFEKINLKEFDELEQYILHKIFHISKSVENYLNVIASTYNTDIGGLKKIFVSNNISFQLFEDGVKTEYAWQQLIYNFHQDKLKLND